MPNSFPDFDICLISYFIINLLRFLIYKLWTNDAYGMSKFTCIGMSLIFSFVVLTFCHLPKCLYSLLVGNQIGKIYQAQILILVLWFFQAIEQQHIEVHKPADLQVRWTYALVQYYNLGLYNFLLDKQVA